MKSVITTLVLLGAMLGGGASAQTCRTSETESNNAESSANTGLCSGTNVTGYSSSADDDWFRIEVASAGTISISLTNVSGLDADWYLYKTTGSYVKSGATSSNPDTGSYSASGAATYYIKVKRYSGSGNYTLNVSYPSGGGGGACTLPTGVNLGRVGATADKSTTTSGGFVLMGGGTDVDAAMQWMINKSGGGDVVVLRSTGTNAYNSYLYGLGTVNSVQTLLVDSTSEGDNACVAQTIRNAEMLFIAGGNQQNYVDYFKGRAVGDAINYLINTKRVPIGGTSAGMAIMGQYYHPGGAAEGTATLSNPTAVTIGNNFLNIGLLANVVTDTHFAQRARQPRQVSFMASTMYNYGVAWQSIRGISADEATAFALDVNGVGKVFGTNSVHFVKATNSPETLAPSTPLTWNRAGQALQVYQVPGTANGTNTFDVGTWTGTGGAVHYWSVNNGSMTIN
jgi:cyanophycinase-like exopeptidase